MKNIKRITAIFVITVLLSCMVFPFCVFAYSYLTQYIVSNTRYNCINGYYYINVGSSSNKTSSNFTDVYVAVWDSIINDYTIVECNNIVINSWTVTPSIGSPYTSYGWSGHTYYNNTDITWRYHNYGSSAIYRDLQNNVTSHAPKFFYIKSGSTCSYSNFYFNLSLNQDQTWFFEGYTVTFDSQGGSQILAESGVTDIMLGDSTGYFPQYTPTKAGWFFVGWSLTPNGSVIKDLTLSADTTLYAVWSTSYTQIVINKTKYNNINGTYSFNSSWLFTNSNENLQLNFEYFLFSDDHIYFYTDISDGNYFLAFYDYTLNQSQQRKASGVRTFEKITFPRMRSNNDIEVYLYYLPASGSPETVFYYGGAALPVNVTGFRGTMDFNRIYELSGWLLYSGSANINYVNTNNYFGFYSNSNHTTAAPSIYTPGSPVDLDVYVDVTDLPSQYSLDYLEVTYTLQSGTNTIQVYADNVNFHFEIPQLYSLGMTITPVYSRIESIQYVFNPNITDQYFIEELAPDTAHVGSEVTFTFAYRYPVNLKQVFYIADNDSSNTKVYINIRSQLYEVGEIEEASEYPVIVFSGTFVMPDDSIKIFLSWEIIGGGTPRGPIIVWDESTGEYSWTEWYDGMVSDIGDINIDEVVSQIPGVFNGILDPIYNLRGIMPLILILVVVGFAAWLIRLR